MSRFDFIKRNKYTKAGFWTALVAGICCFTPLLVWGFALTGLAAYTALIDYVILPMFFLGLALLVFGYYEFRNSKLKVNSKCDC